jgi:PAS domain S-box-containing protein
MLPPSPRARPPSALERRFVVIAVAAAAVLAGVVLLSLVLNEDVLAWPWPARLWIGGAGIAVLLGAAAAVGWLVMSTRLTRSFERLIHAARQMTRGATLVQVGPAYSAGEVGLVERAFDAMVETAVHQKADIEEGRRILEDAVGSLGEGLVLYGADDRLVFSNERYLELFAPVRDLLVAGARIEDVIEAYVERTSDDAGPEHRAEGAAKLLAGFRSREKNQLRLHGGRWLRSSYSATADGGTVIAVADVTDLIRREQELLEAIERLRLSEERFRALAETAPAGIYRMDVSGSVVFANDIWHGITGLPKGAIATTAWRTRVHPEDADRLMRAWTEAVQNGGELRQEYRVRRPDGGVRWIVDTAVPERDLDGGLAGFVGTLADVTEKREIETRLEQSRRLEALGQLSGGVAHDFNNLLMIVLGNAEMLEDMATSGEIKPDRMLRLTRTILGTAERGTELTQSMLGFARRRSVRPEKVAIHSRLQALGALLRRNVSGQIDLAFELTADRDEVMIDVAQFENAVINIALNARDAMKAGGRLTISTRGLTVNTLSRPSDGELAPGRYIGVAIADTGTGMAPEVAARAIEPFFTTKQDEKSVGLGLSLAYGVAKQAGGELRLDTEPGRGTVVTLVLPLAPSAEAVAPSDDRPVSNGKTAASPLARPRVLVVDDDAPVLSVMTAQLGRLGCETVGASSAEGALRLLEADPRFDLMLSDIDLGAGQDGYSLAREARTLLPDLRVLLTTGKLVDRRDAAGVDDGPPVLPKPFTQRELAEKLRQVLGAVF